jgi:hypothetical protein
MLEHPSIRRYSFMSHTIRKVGTWKVTIRPVRAISRKPPTRDPQRLYAEHLVRQVMRQSDPRGDAGRAAETTAPPPGFDGVEVTACLR